MAEVLEQIVTSPEELEECCAYLEGCSELGLDTEFIGERTYHPQLCLIQVATWERLVLIDPFGTASLGRFWALLVDPARTVVVHAGREEVRLCRHLCGSIPPNLFDLQIAAGLAGLAYPLGHANLVHQILGISLQKRETLTEWRERPLTEEQIDYAYDDVRFLLPIWEKLSGRLRKLDRVDWAHEECARQLTAPDVEDPEAVEKWRKLRGLGSLSRRQLGMVRALFLWRDDLAERTNRPPRTIVRDDLLIEIVRRNPTRERDLQMIRGLPRRDLPAILDLLESARNIPPDELPSAMERNQDSPKVTLVAGVLQAVLGDIAVRRRLAPNLVASSNDVKELVRARLKGEPLPPELPLTKGWRGTHILPELLAVLDGQRSVRIADLRAESPFEVKEVGDLSR